MTMLGSLLLFIYSLLLQLGLSLRSSERVFSLALRIRLSGELFSDSLLIDIVGEAIKKHYERTVRL